MKEMVRIDLYKSNKADYAAKTKPALVEIGPVQYLAISGKGAPGGQSFTDCIGALYGVAFTTKMTRKFEGRQDYVICKLECRYGDSCVSAPREEWSWSLLIRTPDFVSTGEVKKAIAALLKRGKSKDAQRVRLETFTEGKCVQMLHVGPYDKEGETVAVMKAFAEKQGLCFDGLHHEIYLSDPRRVAPEKLKTILRHPVVLMRGGV